MHFGYKGRCDSGSSHVFCYHTYAQIQIFNQNYHFNNLSWCWLGLHIQPKLQKQKRSEKFSNVIIWLSALAWHCSVFRNIMAQCQEFWWRSPQRKEKNQKQQHALIWTWKSRQWHKTETNQQIYLEMKCTLLLKYVVFSGTSMNCELLCSFLGLLFESMSLSQCGYPCGSCVFPNL